MQSDERPHCPVCQDGELGLSTEESDIPHFGKVIISSITCRECGFRSTDVVPVENRTPARFTLEVRNPDHLSVRVIRSSTSSVIMPELNIRIDPGTVQEGYVTNVEGVIVRIMAVLGQIIRDLSERSEDVEDARERLEKAHKLKDRLTRVTDNFVDPDDGFTIVLEDPYGNSALVSDQIDIKEQTLNEEEIMTLLGINPANH